LPEQKNLHGINHRRGIPSDCTVTVKPAQGDTMKRLVIALAVALLCSVAWAQQNEGTPGQGEGMHHMGPPSPAQQTKRLTKELGLSQEQSTKIQQIFEAQQQKHQAERDSLQNLSPEERRQQFMQSRQDVNSQIEAILTDAQKKKFEQIQTRWKDRRGREGHPPDGEQGPPPEQQ
jgi:Spy/CpxP family protein refolding chaperone